MRPLIFGILNVTEDSFSDGGRFLAPEEALIHAAKLIADGADVLDVGAASSNPDSVSVPPDVEIARLAPIVLEAKRQDWSVSIDTFSPIVQEWALAKDVAFLNDIRGFPEPPLYPGLAKCHCKLIVMHSVQRGRATRVDTDPSTIMDRITDFFTSRLRALEAAGIARDRLILDPGMGFFLGADPEVSLTVLRHLPELKARFGLPTLISVSRKGFLRRLTGRKVTEIGPATLAAEIYAAQAGADAIRTHDPAAFRDALTIWRHIGAGKS